MSTVHKVHTLQWACSIKIIKLYNYMFEILVSVKYLNKTLIINK